MRFDDRCTVEEQGIRRPNSSPPWDAAAMTVTEPNPGTGAAALEDAVAWRCDESA